MVKGIGAIANGREMLVSAAEGRASVAAGSARTADSGVLFAASVAGIAALGAAIAHETESLASGCARHR